MNFCIELNIDSESRKITKRSKNNLKLYHDTFQYQIGKTYKLEKNIKLELGKTGYHTYTNMDTMFITNVYLPETKIYLVKILGDIVYDYNNGIVVTNKIKIIKELSTIKIINLNNNIKYLYNFIKNKSHHDEKERNLYFNKFLEKCESDEYLLYNFIRKKFYINENERKLSFDKFLKICNIVKILYQFMYYKLYKNKEEFDLLFDKFIKLCNNYTYLYYFIKDKISFNTNKRKLVFDKFIKLCNNTTYLYYFIDNKLYINNAEKQIIFNNIIRIKKMYNEFWYFVKIKYYIKNYIYFFKNIIFND